MKRITQLCFWLILILWIAAAFAMLFHNLAANPQLDTQLIAFAFQFLEQLQKGNILDAIFAVRKYPLLPVSAVALFETGTTVWLIVMGKLASLSLIRNAVFLQPEPFVFAARLLALFSAGFTIWLTGRTAQKTMGTRPHHAILLLLGSILFLSFATSVRPHILVTAMSMLAFLTAWKLVERHSLKRELLAFGAAALAFSTLQNGIFTFIFPVVAYSTVDGLFNWRRLFQFRLLGLLIFGGLLSVIVGYPFLLTSFLSGSMEIGIGLGNVDMDSQPWTGTGLKMFGILMLGSEPLIALAAIVGLIVLIRQRRDVHPMVWAVCAYVICFLLAVGLNGNTPARYFLPLLPFFCVLGSRALQHSKAFVVIAALVAVIVSARFLLLASREDSYQRAAHFLQHETTGPIASYVPHYFFGIPPTRTSIAAPTMEREKFIVSLPQDLPGARAFLSAKDWKKASVFVAYAHAVPSDVSGTWTLCKDIPSVWKSDTGFLWGEVDWAAIQLWKIEQFGPSLKIFCK